MPRMQTIACHPWVVSIKHWTMVTEFGIQLQRRSRQFLAISSLEGMILKFSLPVVAAIHWSQMLVMMYCLAPRVTITCKVVQVVIY